MQWGKTGGPYCRVREGGGEGEARYGAATTTALAAAAEGDSAMGRVWSSSPSMLCLLFSHMLPILSFSNACTRAAPYVPRRMCCAVRAAPCRTCHAVRAALCVPRRTWSNLFAGCVLF